jgi:catechol 2,3-dioxygenase-like lactoylglutathione lyase family enzyme
MSDVSISPFVSLVTIVTESPDRLVGFYRDLLGLQFRAEEYGRPGTFYFALLGDVQLSIHPRINYPGEPCGTGAVRIAFETAELDAVLDRAREHGLEVRVPEQRRGPGVRVVSVFDPDGNEVTFTARPADWHAGRMEVRAAESRRFLRRIRGARGARGRAPLGRRVAGWLWGRWMLLRRNLELFVLDPLAYRNDRVAVRARDLRGYTHVVGTREGVYAIRRDGFVKVLDGQFFGTTVRGSSIYLFQACGPQVFKQKRGRIIRLDLTDGRITGTAVVARELDNGTHQIDFLGDRLAVVETYTQTIVVYEEDFRSAARYQPLGPAKTDDWEGGYGHVNSIVAYEGSIYLLKHNGGLKTGRKSELVRCDADFRVQEVIKLPGAMCHNIVFLEDGRLLVCDSRGGSLIDRDGVVAEVGTAFTRGLSVDEEQVVVGESVLADRRTRQLFSRGAVYFLDRGYRLVSRLDLPAAPSDIRKIDGRDLSLSSFERPEPAPRAAAGDPG